MKLSTISILGDLNEAQKEVVKRTEGHILVLAGPGSGKTLTIVRRIAYLMHQGVSPENILAVTFTNRAAREMKERLRSLLGNVTHKAFVGTLHLLGLRIIRENVLGEWLVINREEQMNLLGPIVKGTGRRAADVLDRISYAKSVCVDPHEETKRVFDEYHAALSAQNAVDFDDLILKPIELLGDPELGRKYRKRFKHIIVDEYQDINPSQYKLLMLLTRESSSMCAVGDPDQAIYGFRGADVGNFMNFRKDFHGATEVALCLNHRSSGNIVRASGMMIKKNAKRIDKAVCAIKEDGSRIVVASVPDMEAERAFIVGEIESRVGGLSHYSLLSINSGNALIGSSFCFSDFAVIYRTNGQAESIEEGLSGAGIPCRVLGRGRMGSGAGSRDVISSLKKYAGTKENTIHLGETKAIDFLESFSKNNLLGRDEAGQLFDQIRLMIGLGWAEARASDILDELNLLTPSDDYDPRADAVTLMTLHMAKGLEFRAVFICGVEDGLIPYRLGKKPDDVEEERRLLYVGMTRARDELFLIHKRRSCLYGRRMEVSPSPFLSEIPESSIQRITIPDKPVKPQRKEQMKLF